MDLLPYNNKNDCGTPNGFPSSPVKRTVVYRELLTDGKKTLVRLFKCSQDFTTDEKGAISQTTKVKYSSFLQPVRPKLQYDSKSSKMKATGQGRKWKKDSGEKPAKPENRKGNKSKTGFWKTLVMTCRLCFYVIIVPVVAYLYFLMDECRTVWDLPRTDLALKENVFGQNAALTQLSWSLATCYQSQKSCILVFTGQVGVGKTHSSSIIGQNFPWGTQKLVSKYTLAQMSTTTLEAPTLLDCGWNLLTVDDLKVDDVQTVMPIIKSTETGVGNRLKKTVLILIFTVHTDEEERRILSNLNKDYIDYYHIPFASLTRDVVEKCFRAEMSRQGVEVPDEDLVKLIDKKMEEVEIVGSPVGCKGVADVISQL